MSHIGQQQPGPIKFLEYIPIVSTFTGAKRLSDTINAKSHLIDIKQNKEAKSHEYKWLCANNQSKWRAGFALVPVLGNIVVMGMDIAAAWHARGIRKHPERLQNETPEYQKKFLMENEEDEQKFLPHVTKEVSKEWDTYRIYNNMNLEDQTKNINHRPDIFTQTHHIIQQGYVKSLSKTDKFKDFFPKLSDSSKVNLIKTIPDLINENYDTVISELNKLKPQDLNAIFTHDNNIFYSIKPKDNPTIFNHLNMKTKIALAEKVVQPNEKFNIDMLMAIVQEDKTAINKLQTEVVRAILDKNANYIVNLKPENQVYFAGDKPNRLKLVNYEAALIINQNDKKLIQHLDPKIKEQLLSDKKIDTRTHMFSLNEEERVKYLNNIKQGEFVKILIGIYDNSNTTKGEKIKLKEYLTEYLKENRTHDKELFGTETGATFFMNQLYRESDESNQSILFKALKEGKQTNTKHFNIIEHELRQSHVKEFKTF